MIKNNFVASRIKDHKSNIVTQMWNIQQKLDDVIAMGRGDTDLDTPRHIIDAGINALNNGATHYTHPMGMPELRREICRDILNNGGAKYNEDEIVVTAGGQEAMFVIALGILNPGDEVLLPAPYWVSYSAIATLAEATYKEIPTSIEQDFKITPEQLEEAISPKTKLIFFNSPNNPSGTSYSED